ncbi:hypothetical protein VTI74DRAFT_359 [Chaetomium olivicolor]
MHQLATAVSNPASSPTRSKLVSGTCLPTTRNAKVCSAPVSVRAHSHDHAAGYGSTQDGMPRVNYPTWR